VTISTLGLRTHLTLIAVVTIVFALAAPRLATGEERATGFVPPRITIPRTRSQVPLLEAASLPSRFDWREQGKVSGVRDQSSCGSCYAFAAVASIEARLLVADQPEYDFSENNAKECEWYESSCYGGNFFRMANFFSQFGTVLEACDPYVAAPVACNNTCPYVLTLLGWNLIAADTIPDPDLIKSYLYTYGPLYTSFYAGSGDSWGSEFRYYDGTYTLYHETNDEPNHAVLIIGWDDDLVHDGGQGAWICKNSWGADWGGPCGYGTHRGFFTMGYGSARMGWYTSYMSEWQEYDPDGRILYYDEGGWSEDFEDFASTTGWGLVKFVPDEDIRIERVEFWTTDATVDVDVYLYDDFDGVSTGGLLASSLDHSFAEVGYHSVKLPTPVVIDAGDDVYAVVKFVNESFAAPIALDNQGPSESDKCFVSNDGSNWQSIKSIEGHPDSDVGIRLRGTEVENSHTFRVPEDVETLLEGLYLANTGDTLIVAPGTYPVAALEVEESIVIRSEAGAESTFLDASGSGLLPPTSDVITFRSVGSGAVLSGFSITGIQGAMGVSAISIRNASPRIEECVIAGMSSTAGAAVNVSSGSPHIENCTIHNNSVYAALYFGSSAGGRVQDCIVSGTKGGGAITCVLGASPVLVCNDLYGNFGGDVICGIDSGGNFSEDPLFCEAASGNYALQDASPCLAGYGCGLVGALGQGCPTHTPESLETFSADSRDGAMLLTWTLPAPPVQGAYIRYSTTGYPADPGDGAPVDNGNAGFFPGNPGSGDSYLHTGLENGTTYYYTAFAYNGDLKSAAGLTAAGAPNDIYPPEAPSDVEADPALAQVTLSWTFPGDVDLEGVIVRYSTVSHPETHTDGSPVENGNGGVFEGEPEADTTFVHTGLTDDIAYYYSLFAFDDVPLYSVAAGASATPGDAEPPGAVTGFSIEAADTSLKLVWTNPADSDFDGTLIVYSTSSSPEGPTDGSPVPNGASGRFYGEAAEQDSFTHRGLTNGETCYYTAFAFDERLNYSEGTSENGTPVDLMAPGSPQTFTATAGDTAITLKWTNPDDWDYERTLVRYSTASHPVSPIEGTAVENGAGGTFYGARAAADSFVHSGLVNGTIYYYSAFAADEVSNHSAASRASAMPEDVIAPAAVTFFGATAGDGSVRLRWTAPDDNDLVGVAIRYSTMDYPGGAEVGTAVENGSGGLFPTSPAESDSFDHDWLNNEVMYYYSIFAYDEETNYSSRDTISVVPYDQTPPVISISVFQNPYITNYLDIFVVASEAMDDTSLSCSVGGTQVDLAVSDEAEFVCRGDYDLCSTGNLSIDVSGRDVRGNWASAERSFSSSTVSALAGGIIASPDGRFRADVPRGRLEKDSYVLIFESEPRLPDDAGLESGSPVYRMSPGALEPGGLFEVSIDYEENTPDPEHLTLARQEGGQVVGLDSYIRRDEARVAAFVDAFGTYMLLRRTDAVTPDYGEGRLEVFQNAPNPFLGKTSIAFRLPSLARVEAEVISVEGRLVTTLLDAILPPGRHSIEWDGRDSEGRDVAGGLYLYRVRTSGESSTRKMVLLR
jgi:C1A family cysteine protease